MLNTTYHLPIGWLSSLVAGLGILLTLIISLTVNYYLPPVFIPSPQMEALLPWLIAVIGSSFSLLLAALIYFNQVAKQQTASLNLMINNLKKEMQERTLAEESKQKLEIALLQGQKLQSIGTLASGIAHDFNNILYAITGYTEIARDDIPSDTLTYKNLGKIKEAAQRGQELVARILTFSRRQHHDYNIINLKTTIEAALALLRPTIPASVLLEVKLDEACIEGNQTQIHQVLVNLINNAVDAMDGEGTIKISLHTLKDKVGESYCKIEVTDTGHGMDQTTLERIFEPFYTTKEVGKGTGLGLSIVHSIIKEHQGDITVNSQLGKGTNITILLPEYLIKGKDNG